MICICPNIDILLSHPKFSVVICASAGGLNALSEMVKTFDPDWDAVFCVVLHLSRKRKSAYRHFVRSAES